MGLWESYTSVMLLGEVVEWCTVDGESAVAESITSLRSDPSSMGHVESRVNQQYKSYANYVQQPPNKNQHEFAELQCRRRQFLMLPIPHRKSLLSRGSLAAVSKSSTGVVITIVAKDIFAIATTIRSVTSTAIISTPLENVDPHTVQLMSLLDLNRGILDVLDDLVGGEHLEVVLGVDKGGEEHYDEVGVRQFFSDDLCYLFG
ncbi:hypothetical protein PIB30_040799 [Stylosanthes scabra]|uniref:Uncharacterized protein n=1 Tax=Stylosanthes scabra TaxID=79078 RepID=A0ABU6SFE4_9FABA|nr:hypothetical protein [Stylosanthes scabra]